jgi:hypothetical protein
VCGNLHADVAADCRSDCSTEKGEGSVDLELGVFLAVTVNCDEDDESKDGHEIA